MTPMEWAKRWYEENESALVREPETRAVAVLTVRTLIENAIAEDRASRECCKVEREACAKIAE